MKEESLWATVRRCLESLKWHEFYCLLLNLLSRCNFQAWASSLLSLGVGGQTHSASHTLTRAMFSWNVKTLVLQSSLKWSFSVSWVGVMCESHICAHGKNNTAATWLRRRWTSHDSINPEQQWRQVGLHMLITLNCFLKAFLRSLIWKKW